MNMFILRVFIIEAKPTEFSPEIKTKQNDQNYSRTLQKLSQTMVIISKLYRIQPNRTELCQNCIKLKRNERN
jgi:hypothetical protein